MSVTDQLQYESRVRFRYGVLAFCAALFLVGAQVLQFAGPQYNVNELTLELLAVHRRVGLTIGSSVMELFEFALLAVVLNWVFNLSRFRNPQIKPITRWLVVVGAPLAAIFTLIGSIELVVKANQFVTSGNQGYPEADALASGGSLLALQLAANLGALLLTFGLIWTSLNAMRVGLVTKLVGYLGVVAGALFIFPLAGFAPLIQGFWLASLAVTLAARWPGGDLPAWVRGEAVPWPTAQRAAAGPRQPRQPRGQRRKVSDQEVMAAVDREPNGSEPRYRTDAPSPSTSSGKRKRKRK